MARESKLTNELARKIVALIRDGNFRSHAAGACGVKPKTMELWMRLGERDDAKEPYAGFAERVLAAEQEAVAKNLKLILSSRDWHAAAWYLTRKAPNEFADPAKQNLKAQIEDLLQVIQDLLGAEKAELVFKEFVARSGKEKTQSGRGREDFH